MSLSLMTELTNIRATGDYIMLSKGDSTEMGYWDWSAPGMGTMTPRFTPEGFGIATLRHSFNAMNGESWLIFGIRDYVPRDLFTSLYVGTTNLPLLSAYYSVIQSSGTYWQWPVWPPPFGNNVTYPVQLRL